MIKLKPITKTKIENGTSSFIKHHSSERHTLFPKSPSKAVAVLKHVWEETYNSPWKKILKDKIWNNRDKSIGEFLFEIGKHHTRKNMPKLQEVVNEMKKEFKNLHQACQRTNCSFSKFYHFTRLTKRNIVQQSFEKKLSAGDIRDLSEHIQSEEISFPLPDKKCAGKRFLRCSLKKSHKMYNILASTTCKISLTTFHIYLPKM